MVTMMVIVQMYAKNSMARRLQCAKSEQEGNRERCQVDVYLGCGGVHELVSSRSSCGRVRQRAMRQGRPKRPVDENINVMEGHQQGKR